MAGGRYGGVVRWQRGRGLCVDGRWSGLRDDLGGTAGDVGTRPGRNLVGAAGYGSGPALCALGSGQ